MFRNIIILFIFCFSAVSFGQERKKIEYTAEIQEVDEVKFPGASILLGNVKMKHEGIDLTCQQALYYQKKNFFKAIGNVLIKQGDTISQTSKYAD